MVEMKEKLEHNLPSSSSKRRQKVPSTPSEKNDVHGNDNNNSQRESYSRMVCGDADVAALPQRRHDRNNVQGEITKEDIVETKESFEDNGPCLLNTIPSCPSPEMREKWPSIQRKQMGSFDFDDHLEEIGKGLSEDKKSSFALMDSMFYMCYTKVRQHRFNVIKIKEIFSKKYVLIPIVCCNHWRLVIFCHFGQSTCLKNTTRCILLLDSMGMGTRDILSDLRKLVYDIFEAEGRPEIFEAKGRPEIKEIINKIPILVPEVPQQRNDVDCGRFVLYFMKKFMDDAPGNFSYLSGYPYFMTPNWFTSDNFEDFCDELEKNSQDFCDELEKNSPPRSPGTTYTTARTRRSQRIQPRRKPVFSRKSSKAEAEVLFID